MRPHPETHPIKEKQRAVVLEAPPKPGLLSLSGVGQGPRVQCSNGPGVGGQVSLCNWARKAVSLGRVLSASGRLNNSSTTTNTSLQARSWTINHRSLVFQSQKVCRDHPVLLSLLVQSLSCSKIPNKLMEEMGSELKALDFQI